MPCNNILFEDVALTEGDITFTCDQDTNAIGHFVRAIHTHPETGKTTEITTYIASDDRGDAFKNGIGKEIQRIFEARCDIAFARRADPQTTQFPPQWPQDTGTSDTPDRAGPALNAHVHGAWIAGLARKPVFALSHWTWEDESGLLKTGGCPVPAAQN